MSSWLGRRSRIYNVKYILHTTIADRCGIVVVYELNYTLYHVHTGYTLQCTLYMMVCVYNKSTRHVSYLSPVYLHYLITSDDE